MNLSFDQLTAAALGTAYVSEEDNGIHFHRFTPQEMTCYAHRGHPWPLRSAATAGVALSFRTDSPVLRVKGSFQEGWSRDYCAMDITVDGRLVGSVDNFSHMTIPEGNYTEMRCRRGPFDKTIDLGEGEKTVKVYFPWSANAVMETVALADGSSFTPVRPEKKILFYGDSITQGYDALRPMNSYASRVADALGMEQINKAVGSEVYFADLTAIARTEDPALVVVAWGTNDWGVGTRDHLLAHAPAALRNLRQKYPDVPFYAILPIWRGDREETREYGRFEQMREDVRQAIETVGGITLVDGYDLVPHEPKFFGDLRLHPNDEGFRLYAENLLKKIRG